jgi:hypothetical protein
MQCVYHGSVPVPEVLDDEAGRSLRDLITLYLLADKLNDTTTANLVMDEIIRVSEELGKIPNYPEVAQVYESTVAGSPLRRLCRDYYVYEAASSELEDIHEGTLPFQFLQDVILEFERHTNDQGPDKRRSKVQCVDREKCYYHQHDDEHPKCL